MTCKSDQRQRQPDDWMRTISEISLSANNWFNEGKKGKCWPRSHWHKLADTEVIVVNRIIEEREKKSKCSKWNLWTFPFDRRFNFLGEALWCMRCIHSDSVEVCRIFKSSKVEVKRCKLQDICFLYLFSTPLLASGSSSLHWMLIVYWQSFIDKELHCGQSLRNQ